MFLLNRLSRRRNRSLQEHPINQTVLPDPFYLVHHAVLDSTNREAKDRAIAGAPAGLVVVADRQTAGRGRSGRTWESGDGNLYASFVLRPNLPAQIAARISFVAGLAIRDGIAECLGDAANVQVKWPNDILVNEKKVSGLLLESAGVSGPETPLEWLVLGFGVNVESHPSDTSWPAIDMKSAVPDFSGDRNSLLVKVCEAFNRWSDILETVGFAAIVNAWQARAWGLGQQIRVRTSRQELLGRFEGLDEGGALMLLCGKETHRITAGDVYFD